jgi:hypothetical protein
MHRCSAFIFELPLQPLCFLALQCSAEGLQRKHAHSAANFKICSAAQSAQRYTFKKVPIPMGLSLIM